MSEVESKIDRYSKMKQFETAKEEMTKLDVDETEKCAAVENF